LLFFGQRGHSHRACNPLIPHAVPKELMGGVDVKEGRGRHCVFLLELAGLRMLCGKKVQKMFKTRGFMFVTTQQV
jgi:hypothetical protein